MERSGTNAHGRAESPAPTMQPKASCTFVGGDAHIAPPSTEKFPYVERNISINLVGEDDSVLPKANGPTESSAPTA